MCRQVSSGHRNPRSFELADTDTTRYQLLCWRHVPTVVKVWRADGSSVRFELPQWFQQEVDREAMRLGLLGSDAYLEQWAWSEVFETSISEASLIDALVEEYMNPSSAV